MTETVEISIEDLFKMFGYAEGHFTAYYTDPSKSWLYRKLREYILEVDPEYFEAGGGD